MLIRGKILALDLSGRTGWAVGAPGETPTYGTQQLPTAGKSRGEMATVFDQWIGERLLDHDLELVIYEAPSSFGQKTTPRVATLLHGLIWHTEFRCERNRTNGRLRIAQCNPSTLKKFFTGNGSAKKDEMVAQAWRMGWRPRDDNAADALALWCYAVHCYAAPEHRARFEMLPLFDPSHFPTEATL